MGEARVPGPGRSLSVSQLNVQSAVGAWAFKRQVLEVEGSPDVALLQEVAFTESEARGFAKACRGNGFVSYYQAPLGRKGGVMTLVKRNLVQRQAHAAASNRAEVLGVFVEGWLLINLYAHPTDGPSEAAQLCHDLYISCRVQRSHPWIVSGDFNSEPPESEIATLCASFGGAYVGLGRPTRWDSSREIDWSCTNYPARVSEVKASELWISDHLLLSTTHAAPILAPDVGKLPRTASLRKPPFISPEDWRRLLKRAWESSGWVKALEAQLTQLTAASPPVAQQVWDTFQLCLQDTFREALRQTPGAEVPRRRALSAKGTVAEVPSESLPCRGPRQEHGFLAERKVRNRLARLYDFLRCQRAESAGTAGPQVLANLEAHRAALGDLSSLQVSNAIASLKADLHRSEAQAKTRALQDWRDRVTQDVAELSKWLKSKTAEHAHSVEDSQGTVSETLPAAAEAIASYWQDFWSSLRANRPLADRVQAVIAGIPSPAHEANLPLPSPELLLPQARLMKGAGGADGWHAKEICHLPLGVFQLFRRLLDLFSRASDLPRQFFQSRMVCLPKPNKVVEGRVRVQDTRPITIQSVWWRLLFTSVYRTSEFKAWLRATLTQDVAAITGEDVYETLNTVFHEYASRGFLLTLDYTKAFDGLDVEVSLAVLQQHRWPATLLNLLRPVWGRQERFVQWGHHTRFSPLMGSGQPQGDPLGPLVMTLWLQSGLATVSRDPQGEWPLRPSPPSTKVYIDDRSLVCSSARTLFHAWQRWCSWSSAAGLLEHLGKAWAVAKGAAKP